MGKIPIEIYAEGDGGRRLEFSFSWDGNDDAIEKVLRFVQDRADEAGVSPEAFAQSALYHLPAIGVSDDPGQRQVQMMLILYTILQFHTPDDTDRPGAIYDYAGREDIKAQLRIRDKQVTACRRRMK
jgi:hypothetical protein